MPGFCKAMEPTVIKLSVGIVSGFVVRRVLARENPPEKEAFRTIFKRITGLTPVEYRNKYNKQVVLIN